MAIESKSRSDFPLPLPPLEFCRFTPSRNNLLPTPTNDQGVVNVAELIGLVKSTVDPRFSWDPSGKPDSHHLYWRHSRYPDTPDTPVNPRQFCNLTTSQILLPRMFHNWLHLITEEPPVPDEEVMYYRIEAEKAACMLFASARQSKLLMRSKDIPDNKRDSALQRHLFTFCLRLEEAQKLPQEHQPIDFSEFQPSTIDDIQKIGHRLGEIAVRRTTNRVRDAKLTFAATGD